MAALRLLTRIAEVRRAVAEARQQRQNIGLVPTMGALHEGHAALIREAVRQTDFVVVSVFVNPTQFAPNEDLERYPRRLEADRQLCQQAGAAVVFAPTVEEMYPLGFQTFVEVTELTRGLCGASRPTHFRGVTTVVAKLFGIVQPDRAFFGQKDAQQARVVRQMVQDLNFPIELVVCPTQREADGLAMSSRNQYLTPSQRREAVALYRCLCHAEQRVAQGERDAKRLCDELRAILAAVPEARIDYVECVDADTLQPVTVLDRPTLLALAVFIGTTRLIDNTILLPPPRQEKGT